MRSQLQNVRPALLVLCLLPAIAAGQAPPYGSAIPDPFTAAVQSAGKTDQAFVPTEPMRVQLPQDDWGAASSALLPPPPGWNAAEFASLARSMGSSPESEPLLPSDELTMETGRIASHKSGFFQKFSLSGAWFNRGGSENLGLVETEIFLTVALPLPSRDFPLLITPGFDASSLDGPDSPTLPPQLYDAYLDFMWLPKLSDKWLGIISIAPGVYSDFDSMQNEAFRVKAKTLARYDWIADRLQIIFGVLYLNRHDINWLPAGGVIWNPHDDVSLECVFPRPKFAYRFTASGLFEDWVYLAGEFGGDTWSIRRAPDRFDMITYVDWRAYLGVERRRPGGSALRLELGYVFGREVQFDSSAPDYQAADTIMLRSSVDF